MADMQLTQTINQIAEELSSDECKMLVYLCGTLDTDNCVEDVRGKLKSVINCGGVNHMLLWELIFRIKRYDILKKVLQTNKREVEEILGNGGHVSQYRVLMADISDALGKDDLQSLIFLLSNTLPTGRTQSATSFLDVVVELEKLDKVSCTNVNLIEECLLSIRRVDLAKKVQRYRTGGQASTSGINVQRQMANQQCLNNILFHGAPLDPPVHRTIRHHVPNPQAPENIQIAVPETGWQYGQSSVEVYRMQAEPRGTCVIIDCVGSDGDILKETFSRLHFRVLLHKWPSLEDIHCVLRGQARTQDLQGHDAFICCIISRATSSDLLATQQRGPGLSLDGIRQLFTAETCPGLAGKPKLFFIQSYGVSEPCGQYGYRDEDLETDSPATTCAVESIPTEADVFWSLCRTNEQQLQHSGHQSVYLRTLCAALLNGQRRKLHLVDVHTEVNAVIYDHNQELPGETYSVSLRHTLRKNLFM